MTRSGENRSDREVSASNKFRWECPFCGDSSEQILCKWGKNALRGLMVHIYFADDSDHGPAESYPNGDGEEKFRRFVNPAGGKEATAD